MQKSSTSGSWKHGTPDMAQQWRGPSKRSPATSQAIPQTHTQRVTDMTPDYIAPELAIPMAIVLWSIVAIIWRRDVIRRRKETRRR